MVSRLALNQFECQKLTPTVVTLVLLPSRFFWQSSPGSRYTSSVRPDTRVSPRLVRWRCQVFDK